MWTFVRITRLYMENPHLYATLSFYWHEINNVWPYCVSLTRCHRTEAWEVNTYGWKKSLFPGLNRHPLFFLFIPVTVWERQQSLMYGRAFLESNSHTAKKPGVPSVLVVVASKRQVHIWSFYGDTTNDKMNLLIKVDCGIGVVMALKKCMRYKRSLRLSVAQSLSPHSKKQIGEKSSSSFS